MAEVGLGLPTLAAVEPPGFTSIMAACRFDSKVFVGTNLFGLSVNVVNHLFLLLAIHIVLGLSPIV